MKIQLLLAASLLSLNVNASDSPFYLGIGVGETDFDDGGEAEKAPYPVESNTKGQTYKLYGGVKLNQHIGFEGQYTRYGDTIYSSSTQGRLSNVKHESYSLAVNIGYHFDFGLRPFVTLGMGMINMDVQVPAIAINGGAARTNEEQEVLMRLGAGFEYTHPALRQVTFRLAYEKDEFDNTYHRVTDSYSVASAYLGASVNF
jgi:opacity protein-like surface antigen